MRNAIPTAGLNIESTARAALVVPGAAAQAPANEEEQNDHQAPDGEKIEKHVLVEHVQALIPSGIDEERQADQDEKKAAEEHVEFPLSQQSSTSVHAIPPGSLLHRNCNAFGDDLSKSPRRRTGPAPHPRSGRPHHREPRS